jgi:hypothetical protein
MTGYAAFARVERGRVSAPRTFEAAALALDDDEGVVETPAASEPSAASRLSGFVAAVREQWAITTFYLFDANSWR